MNKTPKAIKTKYGIDGLRAFRTMEAPDMDLDVIRRRNELWLEAKEMGWKESEIADVAGVKFSKVRSVIAKKIVQIEKTLGKIKPPENPIKAKDLTPKEKIV